MTAVSAADMNVAPVDAGVHPHSVHQPSIAVQPQLLWKLSIDMLRPMVRSEGNLGEVRTRREMVPPSSPVGSAGLSCKGTIEQSLILVWLQIHLMAM